MDSVPFCCKLSGLKSSVESAWFALSTAVSTFGISFSMAVAVPATGVVSGTSSSPNSQPVKSSHSPLAVSTRLEKPLTNPSLMLFTRLDPTSSQSIDVTASTTPENNSGIMPIRVGMAEIRPDRIIKMI